MQSSLTALIQTQSVRFAAVNPKLLMILALGLSLALFFQSTILSGQSHDATQAYLLGGVLYVALILIYLIWLLAKLAQAQPDFQTASLTSIFLIASPFLGIAFASAPATSDVYSYLHSGAMVLSSVNPYIARADSFASPFSPYLVWKQTSTYGPVSQIFFALTASAPDFGVAAAVYVFKLLCLLFHVLSGLLVFRLGRGSAYQGTVTLAYLINPILLFENVKQAHVDVILNFIVLLAIFTIVSRRYVWTHSVLILGALCKTLPIIWLPILWIHLLRLRLWSSLALCFLISVCVFLVLWTTIFPTIGAWTSLLNPGVAWQSAGSLHNLLDVALHYAQGVLPAAIAEKPYRISIPFKFLTYAAFIGGFIALAINRMRQDFQQPDKRIILDMGWSALVLFLLATPWYQPWYATVFISFAAALAFRLEDKETIAFVLIGSVYSVCSASYYLFAIPQGPPVLFALVSVITVVPSAAMLFHYLRISRRSDVNGKTAN